MNLLGDVKLVLLDFDGLLVDTEQLHFLAYKKMCMSYGFVLPWEFKDFCEVAHRSSTGIKEKIYLDIPSLKVIEPDWAVLYAKKKVEYKKILENDPIHLLPGVKCFLNALEQRNIPRAVVTNSPREQIDAIKSKIPELYMIPYWYTREDYKNAKPAPDGYLKALADLAQPSDKVLGFEDTYRGFTALDSAKVKGVVVSDLLSEEFNAALKSKGALIYPSFTELLSQL